jgi:hypothetical protein
MNRLRKRIGEVEKSMGNEVKLISGKMLKEALKDDSSISEHFELDKQYEVTWPDLSKPDYRTAVELSTPELYGYMLSIKKN